MIFLRYRFIAMLITCVAGILPVSGQDPGPPRADRKPAVAGSFYPPTADQLEFTLKNLFAEASPMKFDGGVQFLIVPHAGYTYSGVVSASGYESIPKTAHYKNIFVLATSHREQFDGASVYAAGNYITPLGEVKVNLDLARTLINEHRSITYRPEAHDREHSIEVQLPFLQYSMEELPPIVPIVMGNSSLAGARELATALYPYFIPENLFIVSSDFSHYPSYEDAVRIDRGTAEAITTGDPQQFYNILRKNSREAVPNLVTSACGWSSILAVLYMAEKKEMEITPILYRNSGDSRDGEKSRVVGYWALAGHLMDISELPFRLEQSEKNALLRLSRKTLETYIKKGTLPEIDPSGLSPVLRQPAGAFVSLYAGGRLRGCIGEFNPSQPLYDVVQRMTVAAATRDPRFAPVEPPELPYLSIEISVLTPLHRIHSIEEFQLGKQGIYMTKDGKSGTYLPQVAEETGWDTEEFLGHCSRDKAGLGWEGWKSAELYTYEAIVFGEEVKE
ncbi:MAG: AmmeMemoRadiSam system protein B [Bacteroidales bacterium]